MRVKTEGRHLRGAATERQMRVKTTDGRHQIVKITRKTAKGCRKKTLLEKRRGW